jgi:hypothetical protein
VARKVAANTPPQRRAGVNRAQLKALAARQAMTNIPVRPGAAAVEEPDAAPALDLRGVTLSRRRVVLTREEEFNYIRADLIRLTIVAAILFAVLIVVTIILR